MKNLKITFALVASALVLTSCKDEKQEKAQQSLEVYTKYVDSLSTVAKEDAVENWGVIENNYTRLKTEAETALAPLSDKSMLESSLENSATQYEEFKNNVLAEKEKMDAMNSKTVIYKALFGSSYVNDDMKFNWVNKSNILSVYDNFVNAVQKNKDSYSREDWDEIKLVYEALDTRKNTVEKEGLSGADNRKIAALKLKFSPMYTVNRMGAKSEENSDAKK
ncbi:hypothetical protein [Flavobacterium eburneipallidum]|uniref:hypothetical protein n=1 Tax=Flavobacterium eburneipallidum TaxID=3003263 RepID=UPI002482C89C|nr:hypothetical protein [Flavobacterium eburneipallidum]